MKLIVLIISLFSLILMVGCGQPDVYYYKTGNTIQQTKQDWKECFAGLLQYEFGPFDHEAYDTYEQLGRDCMWSKGYKLLEPKKLGKQVNTETGTIQGETYCIAGD